MNLAVLTDIIKETKNNWRFIFEDPLYDKLNFIPGQLIDIPLDEFIIEFEPPQLGTNLVELKPIHYSKSRSVAAYSSLKGYS